jgi:Ulp1 family protease
MTKMLGSIETFDRWFGGLADRFLAAPKWCIPVNVTETHFFFMVVLVEEMRVEVYDSIRQDAGFYEKYFAVAKKTADAAAHYSGKTLSGKWSLTVNQKFPQQHDGHNCAFAMMCGIFDHLTGESISTSREDFVGLRKTLAEVMYREVPESFK